MKVFIKSKFDPPLPEKIKLMSDIPEPKGLLQHY